MSTRSTVPITVAVSTVNRPAELARCLDAILRAAVLPGEIIVVDQGGASATGEALGRLAAGQVKIAHLRRGLEGLSAARNAAIAAAAYPNIAITDDDCVPGDAWIAALWREFCGPNPPDAIAGGVLPLGPPAPGAYAVSSRTGTQAHDFRGRALPWKVGSGGNFCARLDWLRRVGGYDVRLGAGSPGRAAEDIDLFYRLLRAGAVLRFAPEAVVYHARQDEKRRMASRSSYGFGVGAFCALGIRRRDPFLAYVLVRWLAMRARRAALSKDAARFEALREEWRVCTSTLPGFVHGLRAGRIRS